MGCIQLKTHVLILGYIGLWICLGLLLTYGFDLNNLLEKQNASHQHNDADLCNFNSLMCLTPVQVKSLYIFGITLVTIPHLLLIYGTLRNKHLLLLPWLISMAILLVAFVCDMLIRFVTNMESYATMWPTELVLMLIIYFLMYNWYSVLIYSRQLRIKSKLQISHQIRPLKEEHVPFTILEKY